MNNESHTEEIDYINMQVHQRTGRKLEVEEIKTWTTYRMADGSSIYGDYAWVENEEYFEEVTEPTKVIKETWVLQSSEIVIFEPFQNWYDDEYDEWYEDNSHQETKLQKRQRENKE